VNDRPHIGHAYTTIAADLLARFHRLAGRETFFLTGTDEHGSKVAQAAAEANLEPRAFCDEVVEHFQRTWKALSIANDGFIRTTSPRHLEAVRKILDAMRQARTDDGREVVYSDYYEGLYCTGCEKFLTEKDLVDGVCPDHKTPPEKLREKNYFFRLTAFTGKIKDMILSGQLAIHPEERRAEVLGLIDQDLPDFSLSRERVEWGIPLSFDRSQVAYVWVDALSNYISAIGYADDETTFHKWWNQAEVVHLMAKDILKFHCLYWPAMLMAAGVKLPDVIYLHGFFTVDGDKMSKTLGNQIDPNDMVARFGADGTRYLLLTQYPFGVDGDIQASRFVVQYNADLANDLGNLVSRVVKMVQTHFDGRLPAPARDLPGLDTLMEQTERVAGSAYEHVKHFRLHSAIAEGIGLARAANKFFNDTAPWKLAKAGKTEELGGILYACCETLRVISIILWPAMPGKMMELRGVLGLDETGLELDQAMTFFSLLPGTPVRLEVPLFPRLDNTKSPKAEPAAPEKSRTGLLDIKEVTRVQMRVAEVMSAERIQGGDKLLKLIVDIGQETRQIVAGIAGHYKPEDLVGRRIAMVINLKPARILGVESNGMLLAAYSGDSLRLLVPDGDIPIGALIS
jgi:methionyl-tRNA synthetase